MFNKFKFILITALVCLVQVSKASACYFPSEWWKPVPLTEAKSWEILPQEADCEKNEVILSKRTELGVFSNFAATPIIFHNVKYASIEGFWQSLKYPENANDPRAQFPNLTWAYTREEVMQLTAETAKKAGDLANANMKKMGIAWVSFEGERFDYRGNGQEKHYQIIEAISKAKVEQNPEIKKLLLETGNLTLKPDHKSESQELPSYRYYDIYMKIRKELQQK